MFAKSSLAIAVGLSSVLVAANPSLVPKGEYPPGMPSECIPYYTPPTVCSSTPPAPTYTPVVPPTTSVAPPSPTYTPPAPSYTPESETCTESHTPPASTYTPPAPPASTYTPPAPPATTHTPPATTVTVTPPKATHISQCNTGGAQCCNSVQKSSEKSSSDLLGLVGVALSSVDVLVGLGCTPISVIGLDSGASCNQQPVCCSNNSYNGLINIGCSPISL